MNKIITVVPAHQGAGGKFMATSIAYGLRLKNPDPRVKIALVDFYFSNPYLGWSLISKATSATKDARGIDTLLEKIDSHTLNNTLFMDNMIKIEGQFDILKGSKTFDAYDSFSRTHIETIIEYLKKNYDYVVISTSSLGDNAGTVFGIAHADEVVYVSRMNTESLLMFDKTMTMIHQYMNVNDKKINIVFNYRTQDFDLDFTNKLNLYKDYINVIGDMKYYPYAIDNQNIRVGLAGKITRASSDYNKQVLKIVNSLIQ